MLTAQNIPNSSFGLMSQQPGPLPPTVHPPHSPPFPPSSPPSRPPASPPSPPHAPTLHKFDTSSSNTTTYGG
eukprot:6015311-Pleurochrysis_carterae.AAC.1